jgi:hypothetical protein
MKAKFIEEVTQPTFKPVNVALTFETQAEVNEWYNMMGYNVTVPREVNPSQMTETDLGDTMKELRSLLKDKVVGT